jgi:hypothetical protein
MTDREAFENWFGITYDDDDDLSPRDKHIAYSAWQAATKAERERCAKICDDLVIENAGRADLTAYQCAKAIKWVDYEPN